MASSSFDFEIRICNGGCEIAVDLLDGHEDVFVGPMDSVTCVNEYRRRIIGARSAYCLPQVDYGKLSQKDIADLTDRLPAYILEPPLR